MFWSRINEYTKVCQIRCLSFLVFWFFILPAVWAQNGSFYDQGLAEFLNNNPGEAAAFFETSIAQGNTAADVYLYLGYSYEQMELFDQGISTLEKGLPYSRDKRHIFYFNMGNLYLHKGDLAAASDKFTLAIGSRSNYALAYLNRANTRLSGGEFDAALSDYQSFLNLEPNHAAVHDVRKMIGAVQSEIVAEETRKIEEKRLAALEEERRRQEQLVAEQKAREEVARREALLNDILGNLNQAGSEARTLGAGTEGIKSEEDDFERAD